MIDHLAEHLVADVERRSLALLARAVLPLRTLRAQRGPFDRHDPGFPLGARRAGRARVRRVARRARLLLATTTPLPLLPGRAGLAGRGPFPLLVGRSLVGRPLVGVVPVVVIGRFVLTVRRRVARRGRGGLRLRRRGGFGSGLRRSELARRVRVRLGRARSRLVVRVFGTGHGNSGGENLSAGALPRHAAPARVT